MSLVELLMIITCVTSTITMIVVVSGVMPHVKNGLTMVRDAILWITMVLVLCAMGWFGWQQLVSPRSTDQDASTGASSDAFMQPIAVTDSET